MWYIFTQRKQNKQQHTSAQIECTLSTEENKDWCVCIEAKCTLLTKGRRRRGSIVKSAKRIWTNMNGKGSFWIKGAAL